MSAATVRNCNKSSRGLQEFRSYGAVGIRRQRRRTTCS